MAAKFKKGDIVVLKSGGPKMTVDDPDTVGGDVLCVWFANESGQASIQNRLI
jgi:uncharacterized protein YodC (DUF2158 family)